MGTYVFQHNKDNIIIQVSFIIFFTVSFLQKHNHGLLPSTVWYIISDIWSILPNQRSLLFPLPPLHAIIQPKETKCSSSCSHKDTSNPKSENQNQNIRIEVGGQEVDKQWREIENVCMCTCVCAGVCVYTCRNMPYFRRIFQSLNYNDTTKHANNLSVLEKACYMLT